MISTLLLLSYGVGVTIVLTFAIRRSENYRHLYHQVAWDQYSLETVKWFFQRMRPVLETIYPVVDKLNKDQGRPPTDRRFQLRFIIWWKLYGPTGQKTAVDEFNRSTVLPEILQAPPDRYTRYSLRRFLTDLGENGFQQIGITLVRYLLKHKYLTITDLVIDSFPVYSYLNPVKCYQSAPFNRKLATQIFAKLELGKILQLFPKQHGRSAPVADKLKAWIHHYLWDIPSEAMNHRLIFSQAHRKSILRLEKGWTVVNTYRNFLPTISRLPNRIQIQLALVTEIERILKELNIIPSQKRLESLDDLRTVFYKSHRSKDSGISLAHCAAKKHDFFGRGGLITISPFLELPLLIGLTPKYKQSELQIIDFLKTLAKYLKSELQEIKVISDSEFGTANIKSELKAQFQAKPCIDNYGNSKERYNYTASQRIKLKTVERVIGRLTTQFQLERPKVYGNKNVAIHLQLAGLSDLLIVCYNLMNGNKGHPHSHSLLRGKKF